MDPNPQGDFLQTVQNRLSANAFTVSADVPASNRPVYGSLQPNYLCVGKLLRYSPLSVIGAIEEDVLACSEWSVDIEKMRLLAGRAITDAQSRRSRFHGILPVVYLYIFPLILVDEVDPSLEEYFNKNSAPLDKSLVVLPTIYNKATGRIDYYRKVPMFGGAHVSACVKRVQALFTP